MAYHFNNRIEIINEVRAGGLPGQYEEVTIARPYAEVKTLKGYEYASSGGLSGIMGSIRFIIRYRSDISAYYKVKYNGNLYKINSIANDDGKNRTITLFCEGIEN